MSGSNPLAEAMTKSFGTLLLAPSGPLEKADIRASTTERSFGDDHDKLEAPEAITPFSKIGLSEGLPQK
jgi:hypothetical protein